jgi:pimeloyl-ACP methyl ester carboxylesterase
MFAKSLVRSLTLVLISFAGGLGLSATAAAQGAKDISVVTKDGVTLAATYFPSDAGKEAPAVVILPDYKDSRAAYATLGRSLQRPRQNPDRPGFAVMTVDLRGHGGSLKQQLGGQQIELDAAKLRLTDFQSMVAFDMEAIRSFLVTENDNQKLNLNKLSIIGVGLGASVGTIWAAQDWSAPPLAIGKQGQDVKALVLVSPRWRNQGLVLQAALRQPGVRQMVALMLIYGKDGSNVRSDVVRIQNQVERFHPQPKSSADKASDLLVLDLPDTRLQGSELIKHLGTTIEQRIADFLHAHVVAAPHEWSQRRNRIR